MADHMSGSLVAHCFVDIPGSSCRGVLCYVHLFFVPIGDLLNLITSVSRLVELGIHSHCIANVYFACHHYMSANFTDVP